MSHRIVSVAVIAGDTPVTTRAFEPGSPQSPFSVGGAGAWQISADGVLPVHLYLAWDGQRLYVAAEHQAGVECNGVTIGAGWTEAAPEARIRFGTASLFVTDRAAAAHGDVTHAPASPRPHVVSLTRTYPQSFDERSTFTPAAMQKTQLLALSGELRARLMEDSTGKGAASAEVSGAAVPAVAPTVTSIWTTPIDPNAAPPVTSYSKQNTLRLDARALDHALERERPAPAQAGAADPLSAMDLSATVYDGGALRAQAVQLAQQMATSSPSKAASESEIPLTAAPAKSGARQHLRKGLDAGAAFWREASLVRRATLVLLPVAAVGMLWPDDDAQARAPVVSAARAPAPKPTLPGKTSSGVAAQVPTTAAVTAAAVALPAVPTPQSAKDARVPKDAQVTPIQRLLEAQAVKAAFSGDAASAARLYERLARETKDPRFELALRLVRTDAMRRP